jgi:putative hemolysin
MNVIVRDALLVVLFVLIGGVFSAAEMALVTLRESQVRQLARRSKRGRTIAKLIATPNRFLSAVQLGVTFAGFLSAAFGGATLAGPLGDQLAKLGLGSGVAQTVALILVTLAISYVSIVVGELTGKRMALQRSESFALGLAPIVNAIAVVGRPVIWLLGVSTNGLVRVLGGDPAVSRESISADELRTMISSTDTLGDEERQIVNDVFAAGTRSLREVMVPRTEVDFLPAEMPVRQASEQVRRAAHSRYPVTEGSTDDILGFVHVRDLLDPQISDQPTPLRRLIRPVISLPDTVPVLVALTQLRRQAAHLAVVLDEYGGTAGIVTMEDLLEEVIGEITDEYDQPAELPGTKNTDQDFDGLLTLEEFAERSGLILPEGHYDTLAGFVVARLGTIPHVGDRVEAIAQTAPPTAEENGQEPEPPSRMRVEFRVTELDGRRAARIWMHRLGPELDAQETGDDRATV